LEEAAQLAADLAASTPSATGDYDPEITVGSWLDAWLLLKERQADSLSPKTLQGYRTVIAIWKQDRIARAKVRNIRFANVNDALARMAAPQERPPKRDFVDAEGRRRMRAPLHGKFVAQRSPGTLRGYQRVLRAALEDAKRFGLYQGDNPAAGTMPAIGQAKAAKIDKIDFDVPLRQRIRLDKWTPTQTARFLNHIAGRRLACLWKLYATVGPRRGELAAVGWFSYEYNLIAIESRLLAIAGPHPCEFCPVEHVGIVWQPGAKSGRGVRQIYLPTQLITAIAEHKAAQDAEREAARTEGRPWWDHQLMFCEVDGTPLRPDWITEEFERLVEACGLPKIRLHDLRHNVASLLLAKGMPFASVMKLTGHDEDTLKKIYHHVVGEVVTPEIQAAADWMEALQASPEARAAVDQIADLGASVTSLQGRHTATS
jgi:integrase